MACALLLNTVCLIRLSSVFPPLVCFVLAHRSRMPTYTPTGRVEDLDTVMGYLSSGGVSAAKLAFASRYREVHILIQVRTCAAAAVSDDVRFGCKVSASVCGFPSCVSVLVSVSLSWLTAGPTDGLSH